MIERPAGKPDDYVCVVLDHDLMTPAQDLPANKPIWCLPESTPASLKQGILSAQQLRESHGARPYGSSSARVVTKPQKAIPTVVEKPKPGDDKK